MLERMQRHFSIAMDPLPDRGVSTQGTGETETREGDRESIVTARHSLETRERPRTRYQQPFLLSVQKFQAKRWKFKLDCEIIPVSVPSSGGSLFAMKKCAGTEEYIKEIKQLFNMVRSLKESLHVAVPLQDPYMVEGNVLCSIFEFCPIALTHIVCGLAKPTDQQIMCIGRQVRPYKFPFCNALIL